jgi:predicted transposase/invertase (TIGR01784 family)
MLYDIEIHVIEMPKMPEIVYHGASELEKWLLFLSRPKEEILEELAMTEQAFKQAYEKLKFLSHDPKQRQLYEARLKYLRDKDAEIEYAHDEGLAKGRKEEKIANARKMKAKGLSVAEIMEFTDLTEEEIKAL